MEALDGKSNRSTYLKGIPMNSLLCSLGHSSVTLMLVCFSLYDIARCDDACLSKEKMISGCLHGKTSFTYDYSLVI